MILSDMPVNVWEFNQIYLAFPSNSLTCLNCDSEKINVTMGIKQGDQLLVHVFEL